MAGRQPIPPALSREREVRAWELACRGKTHAAIAEELGVSRPAVSQILARVSARSLKQLNAKVEHQKALQTARLEHIYGEAMAAWEESKKPQKKSRQRKASVLAAKGVAGVKEETLNEAATSCGNFLFLQTALTALGDLRTMWGINAPKKVDVLDQRRPLEKLTDEELERRALENAALLGAEGDGA